MESLEDTKVDNDDDGLLMIVVDHEKDMKNHSTVTKQLKSDNKSSDNILSDTEYAEDRDKNVDKLEFEQFSDETYEDETYLPDDSDYDSNEYCEPEFINFNLEKKKRREWQKYKLREPYEVQSYVNELRIENPELKENEKLLIEELYQKMVKMKPPDPPKDHYVINDIFYECAECGAKKETEPAVSRHWQQHHGPRYAICFACGDDFRNVTNLYRHEKRCVAPDAVLVLKARARLLGRKGRGRPFAPEDLPPAKKKKVGGVACKDCGAVFKTSRSLNVHAAATHAGPRPYRCEACPAAYSKPLSLYKHKREKHINKPFPCETCGRTFPSKYNLKLHMESHQNMRRFQCEHCEKRFARNRSLRIHIDKEHLNLPAPFACHCCPKRYYRIEDFKKHMLKIHGMNLISRSSFLRTLPKLSNSVVESIEIAKKSEPSSQSDQSNIVILDEDSSNIIEFEEISDEVTHCPELDEPGKKTDSKSIIQAIKKEDEKITDDYTQFPELDEQGNETDSKSIIQVVNVDDQKVFDFLKCTEKFESGSEIEQQEPIEIQLIEDDGNNNTDNEKSKENHDDIETRVSEEEQDNTPPEDLLEYAKNLQQENSIKPKPLIVIKDGQAIFMDKNNVDFFQKKVRKRKNTKTEVFIKDLKADVETILQQSTPDTFDSNNPISHEEKDEIGKKDETTKTKRAVSMKNCVSTEVQEICHSEMKARKKQRRK